MGGFLDLPEPERIQKRFGLTRRQAEVAVQLASGKSNAEIASALSLSLHTVRHHTEQVLLRLGVRSRSGVAAYLLASNSDSPPSSRVSSRTAHDLYLRGRFETHRRGEHLLEAVTFFEAALREEPDFAEAYGGLSLALALAMAHGFIGRAEVEDRILEAAERALALDSNLSDAHIALAYVERDIQRAEHRLRRAIALNPRDAVAYVGLARILVFTARPREALNAANAAVELDPISAMYRAWRGIVSYSMRAFDEAEADFLEAIRMSPTLIVGAASLRRLYETTGRWEEALAILPRSIGPSAPLSLAQHEQLILGMANPEHRAAAVQLLERVVKKGAAPLVPLALIATQLGQREMALELIERAHAAGDMLNALGFDPRVDSLRDEPRFRAVLAAAGVPVQGG